MSKRTRRQERSKRVVHLVREFRIQGNCVIAVASRECFFQSADRAAIIYGVCLNFLDVFVIYLFFRMTGMMTCAMDPQLGNGSITIRKWQDERPHTASQVPQCYGLSYRDGDYKNGR